MVNYLIMTKWKRIVYVWLKRRKRVDFLHTVLWCFRRAKGLTEIPKDSVKKTHFCLIYELGITFSFKE